MGLTWGRLPDAVLLEIVKHLHESLRGQARRLCVSTHTIQRVRRVVGGCSLKLSLEELRLLMYKPALKVLSVKDPIDYATVIEHRASGLSIKDCWKVYRQEHSNGFSLSAFSALVKKHVRIPDGYVPIAGPVMIPVNVHCERVYWPKPLPDDAPQNDCLNPLDGILTIDEPGTMLTVRGGEFLLRVKHYGNSYPKGHRFMRATHGLRAILVECDALISIAALDWLETEGITLYISTRAEPGRELGMRVFAAARSDSTIRMAQYAADRLRVSKQLVCHKFAACKTLRTGLLVEVKAAKTIETLRLVEARYSLRYWRSRAPVELKHFKSFPTAWRTWDGVRVSAISGVNSSATHPVNAMLNYAYAIIEARYEIAACARGLDISHACLHDGEHRRALVFDLVEFDRIPVTDKVLSMVRRKTWKRNDFRVDLKGCVRLTPPIAREIAAAVLPSRSHVRDVINRYCRELLYTDPPSKYRIISPHF